MLHRNVRSTMGWLVAAALGLGACSGDNYDPAPNPVPPPSGGATTVRLAVQAPTPTSGVVGTAVVTPVIVKATDVNGNALAGQIVNFSLTSGGTVQQSADTTDAQGLASPGTWTLGTVRGSQRLIAAIGGSTAFVDVNVVTAASKFATVVPPFNLEGNPFVAGTTPTTGLTFTAVDSANNRIGAGIRIRFRALTGTLPAADSAINTNTSSTVTPRWVPSTLLGPQRLEYWYVVNGVQVFDTVTTQAVCFRSTALAVGGSVEGQWSSSDCRTTTSRRDEYNVTWAAQDMRQITLSRGAAGYTLAMPGIQDAPPPAYLYSGTSPYNIRYILPAGTYTEQADWTALTDQVYTIAASSLGNGTSAYWGSVGCGEVGNTPVYISKGLDGFNFLRSANTCNIGGLGDQQDRYLIQLAAGEKLFVELLHGTTGTKEILLPQFNLYIRDASSLAGAVLATAPAPAKPDEGDPWIIEFTAPSAGLYEVIVGTTAAYDPDFQMDYELITDTF